MVVKRDHRHLPHQRHPHRQVVHTNRHEQQHHDKGHLAEVTCARRVHRIRLALACHTQLDRSVGKKEQHDIDAHDEDEAANKDGHQTVGAEEEAVCVAADMGVFHEQARVPRGARQSVVAAYLF